MWPRFPFITCHVPMRGGEVLGGDEFADDMLSQCPTYIAYWTMTVGLGTCIAIKREL